MPEPAVPTRWQRWRDVILLRRARGYIAQKYGNNRVFWKAYRGEKQRLAAAGEKPTFTRTLSETLKRFAKVAGKKPKLAAAYLASSFLPLGFLLRFALPSFPSQDKDVLLKALAAEKSKSWRWFGWFRRRQEGPAQAALAPQQTQAREELVRPRPVPPNFKGLSAKERYAWKRSVQRYRGRQNARA